MNLRGTVWLAAAAERPEDCQRVWQDNPREPYVVPTGRMFDVVSVELRMALETVDLLRRRRMPLGPVVLDYGAQRAGFLLPTMSGEVFSRLVTIGTLTIPAYRYLGRGSFVVLPGPLALAADRYQWLSTPPRRPSWDARWTAALALMLVAGVELMERADRFGTLFPPACRGPLDAEGAPFMEAVESALLRMQEVADVHG